MAIKTKQWRLTLKCLTLHKYNIHKILLLCSVANLSNCPRFLSLAKHSPATSYDLHTCLYINNSLKRKDHLTGISSFVIIFNGFKRKLLWLSQKPSKGPSGPLARKCNRKLGASHPMLLHALPAYWPPEAPFGGSGVGKCPPQIFQGGTSFHHKRPFASHINPLCPI